MSKRPNIIQKTIIALSILSLSACGGTQKPKPAEYCAGIELTAPNLPEWDCFNTYANGFGGYVELSVNSGTVLKISKNSNGDYTVVISTESGINVATSNKGYPYLVSGGVITLNQNAFNLFINSVGSENIINDSTSDGGLLYTVPNNTYKADNPGADVLFAMSKFVNDKGCVDYTFSLNPIIVEQSPNFSQGQIDQIQKALDQ